MVCSTPNIYRPPFLSIADNNTPRSDPSKKSARDERISKIKYSISEEIIKPIGFKSKHANNIECSRLELDKSQILRNKENKENNSPNKKLQTFEKTYLLLQDLTGPRGVR